MEPPKPTLGAYAVSISLAPPNGVSFCNTVVAPNPEAAVAMVMHEFMRQVKPDDDLLGIAVTPISLEWLRFAVNAVETGKGEGAQVLSLVQKPGPPQESDMDAQAQARARSEAILSGRVECVSTESFAQRPPSDDPAA